MSTASFAPPDRRTRLWIVLVILLVGQLYAALVPPLQSPDETDHLKRAYMLSRGQLILHTPAGASSGGMVDTGLTSYLGAYYAIAARPHRKLSADETAAARRVRWSGKEEFSAAPGTGYYLPIIYLPQAAGLAVGKLLGLTVERSYYLARFAALLAVAGLLVAAFSLHVTSPLVIGLLVIPMSVFQAASASLDGVSNALAIFAIAAFLRLCADRRGEGWRLFILFAGSVVVLATSRVHLLPLLALVPIAGWRFGRRRALLVSGIAAAAVLLWLAIAMATTVDTRRAIGASPAVIALFYLQHPLRFLEVLAASLSPDLLRFYRDSFIGILGWLDTRLPAQAYVWIAVALVLAGLSSISVRKPPGGWLAAGALAAAALASVLLAFFALLVTWSPHPAGVIEGIQGRYFLVPVLMLAYATAGGSRLGEGIARKSGLVIVVLIGAYSIVGVPRVLLERYFMARLSAPVEESPLRPSEPLEAAKPIILSIEPDGLGERQALRRLGVLFGTYARVNEGRAQIRLQVAEGDDVIVPIELARLEDNRYRYFDLEPRRYVSAAIEPVAGGGVSVWEIGAGGGRRFSCLVKEYVDGQVVATRGCPDP
jgi:hypothetical protein